MQQPASVTIRQNTGTGNRPVQRAELAEERSFDWFQDNMIHTVPAPYPGAFRRVYPGFVQLTSFMHMNWDRHVDAQARFFDHLVDGDEDSAEKDGCRQQVIERIVPEDGGQRWIGAESRRHVRRPAILRLAGQAE